MSAGPPVEDPAAPSPAPRPFPVTHRSVLAIAVPMTLAFVTTPLLGLVDTAVVGRSGVEAQLAGLAVGAIVFDVVFTTFNFLRAGTTGLVAQAFGRDDAPEQTAVLLRALLLAAGLGLLVLVLSAPILALGLWLVAPGPAVGEATALYFSVRILAAPLTLGNYVVLGWALGRARAGLGLALQVVLNGTNIALSLWLGLHLGWNIEGVAWATVAAEAVALALGLLVAWRSLRGTALPARVAVLDGAAFMRLLRLNRDIMIRSFCLLGTFFAFTAFGARFGTTTLAANAVLMNFFLVGGFFLDGLATAAEQLAGRAIGARWAPAFDRAVRLTLGWGLVMGALLSLAALVFGPLLIDVLTTAPPVRALAREYLAWAALTALVGAAAFQMDGVFIGATWSAEMRDWMLVSTALFALVAWVASGPMGNHGLWLALLVFLGARGATLLWRLPRRRDETFAAPRPAG